MHKTDFKNKQYHLQTEKVVFSSNTSDQHTLTISSDELPIIQLIYNEPYSLDLHSDKIEFCNHEFSIIEIWHKHLMKYLSA